MGHGLNQTRFAAFMSSVTNVVEGAGDFGTLSMIAQGTPFERPKICDSILDAVGGTPLVS